MLTSVTCALLPLTLTNCDCIDADNSMASANLDLWLAVSRCDVCATDDCCVDCGLGACAQNTAHASRAG